MTAFDDAVEAMAWEIYRDGLLSRLAGRVFTEEGVQESLAIARKNFSTDSGLLAQACRRQARDALRAALPVIAQALRDDPLQRTAKHNVNAYACPSCKAQAADFVEGLAHGGPERTASGRVLADDDFERLGDEAEEGAGFDAADVARFERLPDVHFVAWGPGRIDGFHVGDDFLPLTEPVELAGGEWVTLRIAGEDLVVVSRGSHNDLPEGFDA